MKLPAGLAFALLVVAVATTVPHAAPGPKPLLVFATDVDGIPRLHTVRPDGGELRIRSTYRRRDGIFGEWSPDWSPDGRALAFVRERTCKTSLNRECFEIWTRPLAGSSARRVTTHVEPPNRGDVDPAWSPDGRWIAFARYRECRVCNEGGDVASIHLVASAGGSARKVTTDETYDRSPAWSPNGKTILFVRNPPNEFGIEEQNSRLVLVAPDGSNLRSFPGELRGDSPAWSPDGRWVAFTSYRNRNGQQCGRDWCRYMGELYLVRSNGTGLRRMTWNKFDDRDASWSPDGRWIVFSSGRTEGGPSRYRIYRIRARGGRPLLVAKMPRAARDPAWRPR